jgi:DNA polymerase-3 subunit alpha
LDTCSEYTATLCQIPGGRGGKFKLPTLSELYKHLFDDRFSQAHNATADVEATARTFFELLRQNKFPVNQIIDGELLVSRINENFEMAVPLIGLSHENLKAASATLAQDKQDLLLFQIHLPKQRLALLLHTCIRFRSLRFYSLP